MDEYRIRLCQINRNLLNDPLDKTNLGVLNAINYMIYILNEWKNSKFFIQMQLIDMRYKQFEEKSQNQRKMTESIERNNIDDDDNESYGSGENINTQENLNSCEYQFELCLSKEQCEIFDIQMNVNILKIHFVLNLFHFCFRIQQNQHMS